MADYYPLIARAVQNLADSSPETRYSVYERARAALTEQLRSLDPPLSEAEIEQERQSLDEAILQVEAGYAPPPMQVDTALPGVPPGRPLHAAMPPLPPEAAADDGYGEPPHEPDRGEFLEPPAPARPRVDSRAPVVAPRNRGRTIALGAIVALAIGTIAVAAWYLRDQPADLSPQVPVAEAPAPRPPEEEKFNDRVGGVPPAVAPPAAAPQPAAPQPAAPPPAQAQAPAATPAPAPAPSPPARADVSVAQRAIYYEEDPANPQVPKTHAGRTIWRLETINPGQGQPLETAVQALVEIPEAGLSLNLLLRRNADSSLPASHTVELNFTTPPGEPGRAVRDVGLLQFKNEEAARGTPVAGLPVPVRENLFLIGLSNLRNDIERNTELMLNRSWIDLPIRTASGQRAILSIEKGAAGEQVMNEAFRQWQ